MEKDYIWHYDSPLGGITLGSNGEAITGLWFNGQKCFADTMKGVGEEKILPVFAEASHWLDVYFSGKEPGFTPPLTMRTTPFRKVARKHANSSKKT